MFDKRGKIVWIFRSFPDGTISSYQTIESIEAERSQSGLQNASEFTFPITISNDEEPQSTSDYLDILLPEDEPSGEIITEFNSDDEEAGPSNRQARPILNDFITISVRLRSKRCKYFNTLPVTVKCLKFKLYLF